MAQRAASESIHDKGRSALDAFESLPWPPGTSNNRGPVDGPNAKSTPDVTVRFPSEDRDIPVEVKKSTTSTAQVRSLDYHTTVVWREGEGWWVIPPDDVVRLASEYVGQHCINSFKCFNPGKPTDRWNRWRCAEAEVPDRVKRAFEQGERSPLKAVVQEIAAEIHALYEKHKRRVRTVAQ